MDHKQHETSEKRETANAGIQQPIPRLTGDRASGREDAHTLHKNVALRATFLCKVWMDFRQLAQRAAAQQQRAQPDQQQGTQRQQRQR